MPHIDPPRHDGTSDARPGGAEDTRRPGELVFAALMLVASLGLLWSAYGISGFEALSGAGSVPMATTFAMVVTSALALLRTARLPRDRTERLAKDILPPVVVLFVAALALYGVLLKPLGFLPTSALFLVLAINYLARRGWLWTLGVSLGSLMVIWLIFRIVFSVLMPAGILPEAEIIQVFRDLLGGSAPQ